MRDKNYWKEATRDWDHEIYNAYANDLGGVIRAELESAARGASSVADYGCGVGHYLLRLSRLFDEVVGFDQSPACVALAEKRVRNRKNVRVHPARSALRHHRDAFDVVVCINVAIHPARASWKAALATAARLVRPGGRLVLVVPALESASLIQTALYASRSPRFGERAIRGRHWVERDGIVRLHGVATKHYLRHELRSCLNAVGLKTVRTRKVEFSWSSHGLRPSGELRSDRPWDWLAVATR